MSKRTILAALVGGLGLSALAGSPAVSDDIAPTQVTTRPASELGASAALEAGTLLASAVAAPKPAVDAEISARTAALASELEELGGDVSVALRDVETGHELVVGDTVVEAASTIKVDIVATLLQGVEGRLDRRERRLARAMVEVSDNAATDAMLAHVGRRAVNRFGAGAGLTDTRVTSAEWGETRTTAEDRLRVLRAVLGKESLLAPGDERFLRRLMVDVIGEQRIGVDAAADRPRTTPLKAGYTPDDRTERWYVSSMGEVRADGRTYLLAVVSAGHRSLERGEEVVDRASRLTVDAAARLAATTAE